MAGEYDFGRMREEAARRAREMQARAHMPSQRSGAPHRSENVRGPASQAPDPPEAPGPVPEPAPEPPLPIPEPAAEPAASGSNSMLDALFRDKERTVILALLILLSNDGDHHELMFALLFLLL